jgi:radical SAM protein with 4Fe4S-binding SPASM domain
MFQNIKDFYYSNYGKIWETNCKIRKSIGNLRPPTYVQWIATHGCNLKCRHCGTNARKPLTNELSFNQIKKTINEMGEMGVNFFGITGGEPLLRNDVFKVFSITKDLGIKTGMVTNGSLVKKFSQELAKVEMDSVSTSLDGLQETHNVFRGRECFKCVFDSMKIFENIGIPIRGITTSINQKNFSELENMRELVFNSGANYWRIGLIIPEGRASDISWLKLNDKQFLGLLEFISESRKEGYNVEICEGAGYLGKWDKKVRNHPFICGCGWLTCTIMADGGIQGCPSFDKRFDEGNIKKESFKSIWKNKFDVFRNLNLPEKCKECEYLNACRGGCWLMRIYNSHCYKNIWEENGEI